MKAHEVLAALRKSYGNGAVIVGEVGNATGAQVRRHMDALALGCWPSRGLFVHAIEIKVSRGDLLRELADPSKADAIARYCDRMFLATPKGLVQNVSELPQAWGLLEVSDKGAVYTTKQAEPIDAAPLDRGFLMAVIRAAVAQHSEEKEIERRVEEARGKAWQEGYDAGERNGKSDAERLEAKAGELEELQCALGYANPRDVKRALSALKDLSGDFGTLNQIRGRAREVTEKADALEEIAAKVFPRASTGSEVA